MGEEDAAWTTTECCLQDVIRRQLGWPSSWIITAIKEVRRALGLTVLSWEVTGYASSHDSVSVHLTTAVYQATLFIRQVPGAHSVLQYVGRQIRQSMEVTEDIDRLSRQVWTGTDTYE